MGTWIVSTALPGMAKIQSQKNTLLNNNIKQQYCLLTTENSTVKTCATS